MRLCIGVQELLEKGDPELNMIIRHGDTINVMRAENFSVVGHVAAPGSFPLRRPTTLLDAIAQARGLQFEATTANCYLSRVTVGGVPRIRFDYADVANGRAPNFYLKAGDVVAVDPEGTQSVVWRVIETIGSFFSFGIGYSLPSNTF